MTERKPLLSARSEYCIHEKWQQNVSAEGSGRFSSKVSLRSSGAMRSEEMHDCWALQEAFLLHPQEVRHNKPFLGAGFFSGTRTP